MSTISVLKNIKELDEVKYRLLKIPQIKELHKDLDWLKAEFRKWSQQFSITSPKMDGLLCTMVALAHNKCVSKERLLNLTKAMDTTFYMDVYLLPTRTESSAAKAEELIDKLITTLKTGNCGEDFIPGKRLLDSLKPMKSELTRDQWKLVEMYLEWAFRSHLDIHCNYWLKNRFLGLDEYEWKRSRESLWTLTLFLSEYGTDFTIPEKTRGHHLVHAFIDKIVICGLAMDDYSVAKLKIMNNDITSRVVCLLNEKGCSLQEALDNQYEYTINLHKECQVLRDKINAEPEIASDKLSAWMDTTFNAVYAGVTIALEVQEVEVNEDQTLRSTQWDRMYKEFTSKSANPVNPWRI